MRHEHAGVLSDQMGVLRKQGGGVYRNRFSRFFRQGFVSVSAGGESLNQGSVARLSERRWRSAI